MSALDFSHRVAVPGDTLFREIDGESVILSLDTQNYYGLDPVGTRMWSALTSCASIHEASGQLLTAYDVPRETLHADLAELVSKLLEQRLIQLDGPADPPPAADPQVLP